MGKIGVMAYKETAIYFRLVGVKNSWIVDSADQAVKTYEDIKAKQAVSLVIVTETVFDWPGMGTYIMDSVSNRDYLAIQGAVMILSIVFVVVNLAVDVLYAFIDPRIRYG